MSIGKRIKEYRLKKGLTQTELGDMVGASKQTIYKYETEKINSSPYKTIVAIANALNVTPGFLMGWEEEKDIDTIAAHALRDLSEEEIEAVITLAKRILNDKEK